jgi:hypothetical protein
VFLSNYFNPIKWFHNFITSKQLEKNILNIYFWEKITIDMNLWNMRYKIGDYQKTSNFKKSINFGKILKFMQYFRNNFVSDRIEAEFFDEWEREINSSLELRTDSFADVSNSYAMYSGQQSWLKL